jgi:hypothetical protein
LGCTVDKASADSDEMLIGYIRSVEQADNEYTKADRFRDFIRKLFPDIGVGSLGGFYPELEKYVKYSGRGSFIAGKPDSLFGSLIIEFENVLDDRRRKEAEEQLRRYIAALWSIQASRGQKRGRFTALASDGLKFVVYKPRTVVQAGPVAVEQVVLEPVDQMDITEHPASEVNDWLKRYIVLGASELAHVDPDEFAKKFGVGVGVYEKVMQLLNKGWGKVKSAFSTLYEQWDTHLRIVYGTQVASEDLYLKHTYLATLAKLVVFSSYSGGSLPLSRREVVEILNGEVFRRWGIVNFIEEDLFSWVHKVDEGVEAAQFLIKELANYDLSSVTIDVFKELYQSLVDPEARHDLGEYYTPDWLAEMIVGDVLSDNPYRSVLDPACGSGTFLAMAITYKKRAIRDLPPDQLLEHILESVVGVDIHPLALIISRATYLAAVGRELLDARKGEISVPVYLSDSIRFPRERQTVQGSIKAYSIEAGKNIELIIPAELAMNPSISDRVVDVVKEYAASMINVGKSSVEDFERYLEARGVRKFLSGGSVHALHYTAEKMAHLMREGRDTIWAFILKNYYKPVFLSNRKFDVVVGNPPWLSYRFIKNPVFQKILKDLIIKEHKLLSKDRVELITQMELATLFFVRSASLYLSNGGVIAFVMPRSVLVADQHHNFRTTSFEGPKLGFVRIIDLEKVYPLFNVPSCVVFAVLGGENLYPVDATVVEGRLDKKNEGLVQALGKLSIRHTKFSLGIIGKRTFLSDLEETLTVKARSHYYNSFRNGATIYPKSFWCVKFSPHPKFGIDPQNPYVVTSERAIKRGKPGYGVVELQGNVESHFLYAAVSGSELVPFGLIGIYLTVLPIEPYKDGFRIIRRDEAATRGYHGLAG